MKPISHKLGILTLALLCLSMTGVKSALAQRVFLIGETTLKYDERDRDVLNLRDCDRDGRNRFRAIKLRVLEGNADIDQLTLRYGNGEYNRLAVRENLSKGRETRWIDLQGNKRCIREIIVVGDTDDRSQNRAVLQVYGR